MARAASGTRGPTIGHIRGRTFPTNGESLTLPGRWRGPGWNWSPQKLASIGTTLIGVFYYGRNGPAGIRSVAHLQRVLVSLYRFGFRLEFGISTVRFVWSSFQEINWDSRNGPPIINLSVSRWLEWKADWSCDADVGKRGRRNLFAYFFFRTLGSGGPNWVSNMYVSKNINSKWTQKLHIFTIKI